MLRIGSCRALSNGQRLFGTRFRVTPLSKTEAVGAGKSSSSQDSREGPRARLQLDENSAHRPRPNSK